MAKKETLQKEVNRFAEELHNFYTDEDYDGSEKSTFAWNKKKNKFEWLDSDYYHDELHHPNTSAAAMRKNTTVEILEDYLWDILYCEQIGTE